MGRALQQILATEKPDVVATATEPASLVLLDIHLAEIRALMDKMQSEIAVPPGVTQPTDTGLEQDGKDLTLYNLKQYIEAAGGKMRLDEGVNNSV
ncbi:transcriptional regulator [Parahaliea aestuarii]|uniref:Transcriptional regulator n=1 Tax=Parahaliea aestuarii TaxID=1852021 RepID=A0A5C8ZKV3_9GAMM|nr:transcriptional regulator [Parahaliea aestuarii]TXS89216.1 transcriptional regulator [Parahaliea aestuarii]